MSYTATHTATTTFLDYLQRHKEWSWATFGSPHDGRGPAGPHDHIAKELKEIEADPDDREEWIDVVILAIDGCLRSGATFAMLDEDLGKRIRGHLPIPYSGIGAVRSQHEWTGKEVEDYRRWISLAMFAMGAYKAHGGTMDGLLFYMFKKQAKNMARDWPDWRTMEPGKAIEHVRKPTEENRKLNEGGGFNGMIIGGPDAGNMRRCMGRSYRQPNCYPVLSATSGTYAIPETAAYEEYRHVAGIRFDGDNNRLDFWMSTKDIQVAESQGMNPAQYAINVIVEGYQRYAELSNS